MKKRIVPVVLVAAIALGVFVWRSRNPAAEGRIAISGNIELTDVNVAFKIPGKLVELAVGEGDTVKKGQVLARLDREQLTFTEERERAGLAAAQSGLAQLETAILWQRETAESAIAQAREQVREARERVRELEAGSRPQEVEQARAAADSARVEAVRSTRDYERAQSLIKNDDISAQQFDQFRARHDAAQALLKQSEERLALVKEGPRQETIAAARAAASRAEAALRAAEAQRLELKRRTQETGLRRAEIERSRAQVAIVRSQIGDTEVAAPFDGVVLTKPAEAGEVLAAGTTILTLGDMSRPWLRGYIAETDLGRVKIGQAVRVTTDSYPGKVYQGRITFISQEAEFTPKQIQTQEERVKLVYRVKIEIPNPNGELKANMPADAEIVLP